MGTDFDDAVQVGDEVMTAAEDPLAKRRSTVVAPARNLVHRGVPVLAAGPDTDRLAQRRRECGPVGLVRGQVGAHQGQEVRHELGVVEPARGRPAHPLDRPDKVGVAQPVQGRPGRPARHPAAGQHDELRPVVQSRQPPADLVCQQRAETVAEQCERAWRRAELRVYRTGDLPGDGRQPDRRTFGHVVATGESFELTPWLGNMSFENVVAHPNTGSDATVTIGLDDGDASVGQQVYLYRGTKTDAGNPVQKAGLVGGKLYGIKVAGIPQSEYLKTDWAVGNTFDFQLVDVSQFAGVGGTTANGVVDTLEEDSQAKGVTNFQRPEDGAWNPNNPSDFYFVTTSSFGPLPAEKRTGETRLWRLRFADPTDPSRGGKLTLLVSGPVGTPDNPPATGTQSAGSPGPQMFDNITVNSRSQVLALEDVGGQAYLGGVWLYDTASGNLVELARHDPNRFVPGAPGFLTKDEEASGIIPAPFLGSGWYLVDVQAHYTIAGELVQGGQLLALHVPPGRFK